jgi:hypothetical protein
LRLAFDRNTGAMARPHPREAELLPPMLFRSGQLERGWKARLRELEVRRLMVALRLYQSEKNKPATALEQLVPGYIDAIPPDPFDGQPIRYRLSKGEKIVWPRERGQALGGGAPEMPAAPGLGDPVVAPQEPTREVPAGQGILWSVGEDGHDNGGHRQGDDLIFLVPLPGKK